MILTRKMTKYERRAQNIESWISQKPLVGFSSNFKIKLRGPNQNKKCLKKRWPPMKDDLKILKVEYLSNHWSDFPHILNRSSEDHPTSKMQNEDDLEWKSTSKKFNISATTDRIFPKLSTEALKTKPNYKKCFKLRNISLRDLTKGYKGDHKSDLLQILILIL